MRRQLLQGLAAAAALPAGRTAARAPVAGPGEGARVVVVGAGAFGGWTALSLRRAGAEVTLVDAWGPGNSRASSGGESRVIRAIYGADRIYSDMVAEAYPLWEALDATTDDALHVPTGALWMLRSDDDGYLRKAMPVLQELDYPVTVLDPAEAARRWPQIDLAGVRKLYLEERAGVLAARRCCEVVRDRFVEAGGAYRVARAAPVTTASGRLRSIALADGSKLEADAFVFACGPWLGRVYPEVIGDRLRPSRQDVFYFGAPAGSSAYKPGNLPVWLDFGERIFYGLPDSNDRGFKLADDTRGELVDPDALERIPSAEALARGREFLARRFPGLADAPLLEARVCQYENSPDGDLILDRHPGTENLWLAGGGSGHGFKLGPAVGMQLAAAVLGQAEIPAKFGLARFRDGQAQRTQFDAA